MKNVLLILSGVLALISVIAFCNVLIMGGGESTSTPPVSVSESSATSYDANDYWGKRLSQLQAGSQTIGTTSTATTTRTTTTTTTTTSKPTTTTKPTKTTKAHIKNQTLIISYHFLSFLTNHKTQPKQLNSQQKHHTKSTNYSPTFTITHKHKSQL